MSDDGRGWKRRLPWRPAWLGLPGLVALAFLAMMGGAVRYSESPAFCRSCHIMEPYYQAWKGSAHNGIACVECHYPPGSPQTLVWKKFQALSQVAKYVTRTYSSKPFAEVDDASCMRSGCHSTKLLQGRIITRTKVKFDHRQHLTQLRRGRQLRCTSCHSQVVVGRHIEVTYETCFLCHFKGRGEGRELKPLGGCLACHEIPTRTIALAGMKFNHKEFLARKKLDCQSCHVDVVHGAGDVPRDHCFTCHNQPEKIARFNDVAFIHENHVNKHNVACFHCHDSITHGFSAGAAAPLAKPGESSRDPLAFTTPANAGPALGVQCGYCHQGMHAGQFEMYAGKVGSLNLGLPEMASPMSAAKVDCVGCHFQQKADGISDIRGKTFKASQAACVKCHGPKFAGVWEETKSELASTVARLEKKSLGVAAAVAVSSGTGREELARADKLIRFVKAARGEHNVYLSSLALRRADAALNEASDKVKVSGTDLSALPLLSGTYCATLCHQKVGVKVPPETVQAFGKTMPHKMHTELIGCVGCHDVGAHKKIPLKKGVQDKCKECHP